MSLPQDWQAPILMGRTIPRVFERARPYLFLAVLVLWFFWDPLFSGRLFIHRDLGRYFFPLRQFAVESIKAGKFPLWNPYLFSGNPLHATMQSAIFYPLSIIYYLGDYARAFNYFIVAHIFLAGIFMFLLLRAWRLSVAAALAGAITFMFSGYMISVVDLLTSLSSVTWLPLALLLWMRGRVLSTALVLSVMSLGGEPSICLMTFLLLAGWALYTRGNPRPSVFTNPWSSVIKNLFYMGLILMGLTAFQWIPFAEFLRHSERSAYTYKDITMWSLPPRALFDLAVPYLSDIEMNNKDYWMRQSWLGIYYIGIFAVIFSGYCLFASQVKAAPQRRFLIWTLAISLILAFGRFTPVYFLLYKLIPPLRWIRYPVRFFAFSTFALSALCALGFDALKVRGRAFGLLVLALSSSAAYLALNYLPVIEDVFIKCNVANLQRAILFFVFLLLALAMRLPRMAFPCLVVLDLFTANRGYNLTMARDEFIRPSSNIEFILRDKSLFRVAASPLAFRDNVYVPEANYWDGLAAMKERLLSDRLMEFGLYDFNGYESVYRRDYSTLLDELKGKALPSDTWYYDYFNVKYLVSPRRFEARNWRLVREQAGANLYENSGFLSRAFMMSDKRPATLRRLDLNEVIVEAECPRPDVLVLSDTYYPGWRAFVDGKRAPIERVFRFMKGVPLEAGRHTVRFLYDPFSFKLGAAISAFTVVTLCLWPLGVRRKNQCLVI